MVSATLAEARFPDASFDVVWALESLCHAPDKPAFPYRATAIGVTNNQRLIAYGMKAGSVVVLDALSGKTLCTLSRSGTIRSLAFSADDSLLALGTDEKSVEVWGSPP